MPLDLPTNAIATTNERIVKAALSIDGLSAAPDKVEAFEGFLRGGVETAAMAHSMATDPRSSTCGLVVRCLWRLAGVDMPELYRPYRPGFALAELEEFAKSVGAWRSGRDSVFQAKAGDAAFLVEPGGGHVFTLVEDSWIESPFHSVDGGQVDGAGHQLVLRKERYWWDDQADIIDETGGRKRVVLGSVDVSKLPVRS